MSTPLHIAERRWIVGPLVYFRGGQQMPVSQPPPLDAGDPRYPLCVDHHLACDCREAERSETINEQRSDLNAVRNAIEAVLDGHATNVYDRGERRSDLECRCTGCQIARSVSFAGPTNHIDIHRQRYGLF